MKRTLTTKATAVAGLATLALFGAACADSDGDGIAPGQEEVDTDIGPGDEIGPEDGSGADLDADPGEGDEVGGEGSPTTG